MSARPGGPREFPNVVAEAVRLVARWFGNAATTLEQNGTLQNAVLSGPDWKGDAHDRWLADGTRARDYYRKLARTASTASQALHKLATEIDAARERYDRAVSAHDDANRSIFHAELLAGALGPLPVEILEDRLRDKVTELRDRASVAAAAANEAVEDALAAGGRAARIFGPLAEELRGLGMFGGSGGGPPHGGGPEPDPVFLAMLFGSLADNYNRGYVFQDEVLKRLGWTENHGKFRVWDGTRWINVIPDSVSAEDIVEIKARKYVTSSPQIRGELYEAARSGRGFTLVVENHSRVSVPLQEQIRAHPYGGEIVRYNPGDGGFTTLDGRPVEPADGGGWRYKDPPDDGGDGDGGGGDRDGGQPPSCGGGGLNHALGQEADRLTVEEYSEMPSGETTVPFMPWPSMPVPMPAPAPAPVPLPIPRLVPIIP